MFEKNLPRLFVVCALQVFSPGCTITHNVTATESGPQIQTIAPPPTVSQINQTYNVEQGALKQAQRDFSLSAKLGFLPAVAHKEKDNGTKKMYFASLMRGAIEGEVAANSDEIYSYCTAVTGTLPANTPLSALPLSCRVWVSWAHQMNADTATP